MKLGVVRFAVTGISSFDRSAPRQRRLDTMNVRFVDFLTLAQAATSLRALAREQVALAHTLCHDLAGCSDLKPLTHRLLCFNSLRTTHKKPELSAKMSAQSKSEDRSGKADFGV